MVIAYKRELFWLCLRVWQLEVERDTFQGLIGGRAHALRLAMTRHVLLTCGGATDLRLASPPMIATACAQR
jgi:hypothetical protein